MSLIGMEITCDCSSGIRATKAIQHVEIRDWVYMIMNIDFHFGLLVSPLNESSQDTSASTSIGWTERDFYLHVR